MPPRINSSKLIGLAVVLLGLGLVLAISVHLQVWRAFDLDSVLSLQAVLPRTVDVPFSILSLVGSAELTSVIILALALLTRPPNRVPIALSFAVATLIELVGKTIVRQPGPPHYLRRYVSFVPLLSSEINPGFSFPSGHALRVTLIVILLISGIAARSWQRKTKVGLDILLIAFWVIMLVSRVYLAEHWLTDVFAGTLLGASFAFVALGTEISLPIPFLHKRL